MAEADLVALPTGALDDVAMRVGASLHASADGTGLRIGIACADMAADWDAMSGGPDMPPSLPSFVVCTASLRRAENQSSLE